jgi:hypothetical protein
MMAVLRRELTEYIPLDASSADRTGYLDRLAKEIQRVTEEVQDASSYSNEYDQRRYARDLREFKESLGKAKAAAAPKAKFSFKKKSAHKPLAVEVEAKPAPAAAEDLLSSSPKTHRPVYNTAPLTRPKSESPVREAFNYSDLSYKHDIRGVHDSDLVDLEHAVIDMHHHRDQSPARYFPKLDIRNVHGCLLITGRVGGATHVTRMRESVLVVGTGQLRLHDCEGVDVYLSCGSRPIIEDCTRIRFAPLPGVYGSFFDPNRSAASSSGSGSKDQWDQVDDFNWLKQGHSPNWSILPEGERVSEETWRDVVPGTGKIGLTDILNAVGVRDAERGRDRKGSETAGGDGF